MKARYYFLSFLILLFVCAVAFAQKDAPKVISEGFLNDKAISLPDPVYPAAAKAVRANGAVHVQVTIDENGDVIIANAVSGHPLLRAASVQAARQAKFVPTTVDGKTVKVIGTIVYIFVSQEHWQLIGKALGDAEIEIEDVENLLWAADLLANAYPEISKAMKAVAENFQKDEQAARFQTNAIGDIISQIHAKLTNRQNSSWYFEFGLTVGRVSASYFDETVLRINLARLKELANSYLSIDNKVFRDEDWGENLRKLSEMANQTFFSRKDKSKIKLLIEKL